MKPNRNYNLDYLDELAGGDELFKMEMIRHFSTNTPTVMTRLQEFLAIQDWKLFRDEIHKFGPNLNLMGITEIIPTANLMEELSEKRIETDRIPELFYSLKELVNKAIIQLEEDFKIQS